ncbi:hypothetical protein GALMADRAFT_273322 [Galerina marginata CBS 339.88]|uniref:F-box domain-containing protein n=1 Tax=Galerina marginata (strain CBS 339.88) TaxID=685588 RepID=A0A067S8P6_GALM3|nr:hypothetical protein GALMADRAFT_273322 [Galerina marginata CBS 339.88]
MTTVGFVPQDDPGDKDLIKTFDYLQSSSNPLSDGESSKLHKFRAECREFSAHLTTSCQEIQDQIQHLTHKLAEMHSIRAFKDHQAKTCSAILSEVRSLPVELLTEIFWHCLPAMPYPDPRNAPLLLCQVTSSWREIVLRLPQMWNNLWFPFGFNTYKIGGQLSFKSAELLTKLWFKRAQDLPITLSLNACNSAATDHFSRLLPAVSGSLTHLNLYSQDQFFPVHTVFQKAIVGFSNLESINISAMSISEFDVRLFPPFPNLRRVTFDYSPAHLILVPLAWAQIHYLCTPGLIFPLPLHLWRGLLRKCASLQEGVFVIRAPLTLPGDVQSPSRSTSSPSDTTFRKLANVKLDIYGSTSLSSLFNGFIFPVLKSLRIYATQDCFEWNNYTTFAANLTGLTHLTLWNVTIAVADLISILHSNHSLESLHLNTDYDEMDVQGLLATLTLNHTEIQATQYISPKLKDLSLQCPQFTDTASLLLVARRLIQSRMHLPNDILRSAMERCFILTLYFTHIIGNQSSSEAIENLKAAFFSSSKDTDAHRRIRIQGVYRGFRIP